MEAERTGREGAGWAWKRSMIRRMSGRCYLTADGEVRDQNLRQWPDGAAGAIVAMLKTPMPPPR